MKSGFDNEGLGGYKPSTTDVTLCKLFHTVFSKAHFYSEIYMQTGQFSEVKRRHLRSLFGNAFFCSKRLDICFSSSSCQIETGSKQGKKKLEALHCVEIIL